MFYKLKRSIHIKRLKRKLKTGGIVYFQDENKAIIQGTIERITETKKTYSWGKGGKEIIFCVKDAYHDVKEYELFSRLIYLNKKSIVKDLLGDLKQVNELLQLKMLE